MDVRQFYAEYIGPPEEGDDVSQFKSQRSSMERRRSRSTSDLPSGLLELQDRYSGGYGGSRNLWEAPDDDNDEDDDDVIPPKLPARPPSILYQNTGQSNKPTPAKRAGGRRTGAVQRPPELLLSCPQAPPPTSCAPEVCPISPSVLRQFLSKHHPVVMHNPPQPRERKTSAPTTPETHPPPPFYVNAPKFDGNEEVQPLRRGHGSMIDVRRRPLPSPNEERPSSLVQ